MACRDPASFDAYIRERLAGGNATGHPPTTRKRQRSLGPRSEAARVVFEFVEKDRVSMGEAVLLAIEALPASKTRELRRIVDLFEPWCEWIDEWFARGWTFKIGYDGVIVVPPRTFDYHNKSYPRIDVISAAVGADVNSRLKAHHGPMASCPNCIEFDFK